MLEGWGCVEESARGDKLLCGLVVRQQTLLGCRGRSN